MGDTRTSTDRIGSRWGINDAVIRLRVWGTDRVWELPSPAVAVTIGSAAECAVRIEDRLVSREHVRLTDVDGLWFAADLRSKNGTYLDGVHTSTFALTPGSEIRVGGTTLVAESARSIELRFFLLRIMGWSGSQLEAADLGLRAIRRAAMRRSVLYLAGEIDLVPIAHSLHRHVLGTDRPFVTCDRRRSDAGESVRSVANKPTGLQAAAAAIGGSVCMRSERPPSDFDALLRSLSTPDAPDVQLVVVGRECRSRHDADVALNPAIHVPPIAGRSAEIPMVIDHYALDAAEELLLPRGTFTSEDRAWVIQHAATSLTEIEKATLRLTALRGSRTLTDAANRLRMAPVSLARWLERRALPPSLARKICLPEAQGVVAERRRRAAS